MPSLADQINDGPTLLAALKALQRQFREFATTQPATEQDRQNGSVTLSGQSMSIGYLPERRRLAGRKPVAQTRAQLANTLTRWMPAANSGLNSPESAAS